MEKYLYFSDGAQVAADDNLVVKASDFMGVEPITNATTAVYFKSAMEGGGCDVRDKIVITHANTYASTGHHCRRIAKVMAAACNASPHVNGMTDVIDVENSIYLDELGSLGITGIVIHEAVDY